MKLPKPISDNLRSRVRGILSRTAVYGEKIDAAFNQKNWEEQQQWCDKYHGERGKLEDLGPIDLLGRYEAALRKAERRIKELEATQ